MEQTEESQIFYQEEWLRCANDFEYFAAKYVWILEVGKGIVPFKLYGFQQKSLRDFETNQLNIVHKFRQGGFTTLAVLWSLWRCMFKKNQQIMLMSITDREAIKAGKIVKRAIEYMENHFPWLAPHLKENSSHVLGFADTGSQLEFRTTKAARGQTLTYLIIDEAAFIQNMEDAWAAMYPTVSTGGNVIVISTVNGIGNWYCKMYKDAEAGRNEFNIIRVKYTDHPKYQDQDWIRKTKSSLGERKWAQEFEGSFLDSGDTYIKVSALTRIAQRVSEQKTIKRLFSEWDTDYRLFDLHEYSNDPDLKEWEKGALWIWREPQDGHEYIMGTDCAEGVGEGGDNSAFQVIDAMSLEQVAEFSSKTISPHVFSMIVAKIAAYFNSAVCVVESGGPGSTVIDKLVHDWEYDHLYYHINHANHARVGMPMNPKTRPLILEALQKYLENDLAKVNSPRLLSELTTFTFNPKAKRAQAQKGEHDDLVFALSMALYVRDKTVREVPIGFMDHNVPTKDAFSVETFDKITRVIEDSTPTDLVKPPETKYAWDLSDMVPSIIVPRERNPLLEDFGWN